MLALCNFQRIICPGTLSFISSVKLRTGVEKHETCSYVVRFCFCVGKCNTLHYIVDYVCINPVYIV